MKKKTNHNFFSVKDNFWTENNPTTSSSKFLSNFFPKEDSTVVKLLKEKGFCLLEKNILDELSCGGTGLLSYLKKLKNPFDKKRIVGGSSSGSVLSVVKDKVSFSLGSDTGDSIRRPSSYCGVIGFKPSYGKISRYGLIPMSSSLDTVGIISKDIEKIDQVFSIIEKIDYKDLVTIIAKKKKIKSLVKKKLIIVIKDIEKFLDLEYKVIYENILKRLEKSNYRIVKVEIPLEIRDFLSYSYLVISSSEIFSHFNSLQGITFGVRKEDETIKDSRSTNIGKWAKERIILGCSFLSSKEVIKKAKIIRRITTNWINDLFEKSGDFFLFPGTKGIAPLIKEVSKKNLLLNSENEWIESLLLISNFSGNPSINIPLGKIQNMPVSINIDCSWGNDKSLIELSKMITSLVDKNF